MQELTIVCILMSLQLVFPYCLVITQLTRIAENRNIGLQYRDPCADPESFIRGGPTLTTFFFIFIFLFDEGRENPGTTISGPSSAHQPNAIKWRFAGVPMMAQH